MSVLKPCFVNNRHETMFGGIGQHNLSCLYWNFLTDTRKFQKQNEYRASKGDLQEKQKESWRTEQFL